MMRLEVEQQQKRSWIFGSIMAIFSPLQSLRRGISIV
jgi:hypothetical protein